MLKRLISEDRLDRGIYASASDCGKFKIVVCGCPCFWCWCMLTAVFVTSVINTHMVLTKQAPMVLELGCSGGAVPNNALAHLTGCTFKDEVDEKGIRHLRIGSLEWDPNLRHKQCGKTFEAMKKGELASGFSVSFLGNASNGVVRPWHKDEAVICDFAEGDVSAPMMIHSQKMNQNIGCVIVLLFCFSFLVSASLCLFFPDREYDNFNDRSCTIAALALLWSCMLGIFIYLGDHVGFGIGVLLLIVGLVLGCSSDLTERLMQSCQKRSYEEEDPVEEAEHEALLPSSAPQPPSYSEPVALARPAETLQDPGEAAYDSDSERTTQSGGALMFIAAIALGITAAVVGGILLAVVLSLVTQRRDTQALFDAQQGLADAILLFSSTLRATFGLGSWK